MIGLIKKLFGRGESTQPTDVNSSEVLIVPPVITPPTIPLKDPLELSLGSQQNNKHVDVHHLVAGYGQSIGKQRDHNEDALYVLTTMLEGDQTQIPFGLYIVADGMGGHQNGELAARTAVRAVANYILRNLYIPLLDLPQTPPTEPVQEIMQNGLYEAHRIIPKYAPGGGTTLTAILIIGDQLTIAHVGDSRAYAINPNGTLQVLTRDHTLVKRLEELGQLTADEASQHPHRNVLYRALGQAEPFVPDISTFPLQHPCHLFICSDGLWGVVPEREIYRQIVSSSSTQQACMGLIEAANSAGGPDNITAILVRIPD